MISEIIFRMKYCKKLFILLFVCSTLLLCFYLFRLGDKDDIINIFRDRGKNTNNILTPKSIITQQLPVITLAVVACGQRLSETLNLLKSAILFNQGGPPLHIIVLAEDNLKIGFNEKLSDWQTAVQNSFTYEILSLSFPKNNTEEWKRLFKPCAAQRLFLPSILKDVDSVLYLDTDTLFLSPISEIWNFFKEFNSTQIAGLSPEHEDKNVGWYNRFARHPFYGPMGVNSGVMLMNLTRMRSFKWEQHILPIHAEYKMKITWGDQDLINILFYFHPDKLFVFPCEFNYRPDHCMYMRVCSATNGVQIMHGNRGYFHSEKQPAFSAIYRVMESYQLGKDPYRNFLLPAESALVDENVINSNCGKESQQILSKAKKYIVESDYYYNS